VESLIGTGYPNLEIVIVDDGSKDGTLELALELSRRFPSVVRTVRHQDGGNHGPGASRNLGARVAEGEYLCFLDSDDVVLPGRFRRAVRLLESDSAIDAVCEPFLVDEGQGPRLAERADRKAGRYRLGAGGMWNTDTILIRRSCFLDVGGFSERLRTCEDLVLWGKLSLAARIENDGKDPVAIYRRHPGGSVDVLENSLWAYLEIDAWARGRTIDERTRDHLRAAVWGKAIYVSDRLRRDGRPGLAIRMLLAAVRLHPSFALSARLWKNLVRAALETGVRAGTRG
jgi:glycosyltransferase involved in cell wall biosynthesis